MGGQIGIEGVRDVGDRNAEITVDAPYGRVERGFDRRVHIAAQRATRR